MVYFLLVFSVYSTCLNSTHLTFPPNWSLQKQSLSFCTQHSQRTCCTNSHTLSLYSTIQKGLLNPYPDRISSGCFKILQKVLCSQCDGDLQYLSRGIGAKKGLCEDFCDDWYMKCKQDWFQQSLQATQICSIDSLTCFQLKNIFGDGKQLCEKNGYKVQSKNCYKGIPAAKARGPVKQDYLWLIPYLGAIVIVVCTVVVFCVFKRQSKVDVRAKRIKAFENRY